MSSINPPPTQTPAQIKLNKVKQPHQDNCLFIRLGPNHPAHKAGSFAVLTILKRRLGKEAHLLKEVQAVNSGFALVTDVPDQLEKYTNIFKSVFTDYKVERQANWTTYHMDNIPQSVKMIDELGAIINSEVMDIILFESICDVTSQTPLRAVESQQSTHNGLYSTSWFVSFGPEGHSSLPRTLWMLGTTVHSHYITPKPKTIQCTKCFQWHNARSCTKAQRCRICGSNQHTEETHTTRCTTANPHICPARCIHCSGPHPADEPKCPLHPSHKVPKTRSQQTTITETCKAACVQACAAAGCSKKPVTDIEMDQATPRTPIHEHSTEPPAIAPTTRFFSADAGNRFSLLFNV